MIRVEHLTKRFGGRVAVDDLSFEVKKGEVVGFLGPNGAGKTTTMRILSCFLPPTGGSASIAGYDVVREALDVRYCVGYMPESVPLYMEMRVNEYLRFRARLKGLRGRRVESRLDDVLASCSLESCYNRIIGHLSKGYRQRVGLADALIHEPDVLILDEPSIGLDPNQIRHIRHLIRGLGGRYTVLLSSHILPEVESVCDRILIINHGRIVASEATSDMLGLMRGNRNIIVEAKGPAAQIREGLEALDPVVRVSSTQVGQWERCVCECTNDSDVRTEIFDLARMHGWVLRELTMNQANLEDIFVAMTEGGER
ncbi:MAG: ATP-binding cassette domain-containing protein [Kiritimatiellae bacterium]|nr:ATP-binding cassette domain-containing protein [Kiritimatiellia bacterium]